MKDDDEMENMRDRGREALEAALTSEWRIRLSRNGHIWHLHQLGTRRRHAKQVVEVEDQEERSISLKEREDESDKRRCEEVRAVDVRNRSKFRVGRFANSSPHCMSVLTSRFGGVTPFESTDFVALVERKVDMSRGGWNIAPQSLLYACRAHILPSQCSR